MDPTARDSLVAKLRALQAKTVDNGCTEAEAMTAAAMVDRLLAQHGIAQTELDVRESPHERGEADIASGRNRHAVSLAASTIGLFTDCKVWFESGGGTKPRLHIWGEPQDVAAASYLVALVRGAIDRENAGYAGLCKRERQPCDGATFRNAMALRVARRLRDMKAERDRAADRSATYAASADGATRAVGATGTALVAVKRAVVEQSFAAELGIKLKRSGGGRKVRFGHARAAGIAAGDRVSLNPGIGNGGNARLT